MGTKVVKTEEQPDGSVTGELLARAAPGRLTSGLNADEKDPAALYLASLESSHSRRVMASRLRGVARVLGKEDAREIEWDRMDQEWLFVAREALSERERSPSHINAVFSLLKGIALQAWRLKIISTDAYLRVKNAKSLRGTREPNRRWLKTPEISTLLDECVKDHRQQGLRDAALLALLYGCGLRRSEVVRIDVEDLDHSDLSVLIRGKGNKERRVYPPARAWDLVNEWIRESGKSSGPLFCRIRKGGVITLHRLTDQAVYFVMQQLIARTNVPRFTPHDLRGSFISYLLDKGHDIKTVADIVGHADIQTTAGYDRRGEEGKKKTNRAIDL